MRVSRTVCRFHSTQVLGFITSKARVPRVVDIRGSDDHFSAVPFVRVTRHFLGPFCRGQVFIITITNFSRFLRANCKVFTSESRRLLRVFAQGALFRRRFRIIVNVTRHRWFRGLDGQHSTRRILVSFHRIFCRGAFGVFVRRYFFLVGLVANAFRGVRNVF